MPSVVPSDSFQHCCNSWPGGSVTSPVQTLLTLCPLSEPLGIQERLSPQTLLKRHRP